MTVSSFLKRCLVQLSGLFFYGLLINISNAHELPAFTQLVEKNAPGVVNISSTLKPPNRSSKSPEQKILPNIPKDSPFYDFFQRFFDTPAPNDLPFKRGPSLGSGFIISKNGYIITNHHVVNKADEILVRLNDRQEFIAQLVGTDKRSDIAVLKIDEDDLPALKLAKDTDFKVGEWVLAIGSPFGLDYSVTQGIISAIGRNLPNENYVPFIQTDVAINPGNSGGPLFNLAGEVIGVNSQIYSRTGGFMGLSFAVPIDVVKDVYQQIIDQGYVSRGWLGVLIQNVTVDLAESFDMDRPYGALIARVLPDSPAEQAGLKAGDIIIKYNGRDIPLSSDLPPMVGSTEVGKIVPINIIRDGKEQTLMLTLSELPAEDELQNANNYSPKKSPGFNEILNIRIADIDEKTKEEQQLADHGVIVAEVLEGGAAQTANLRAGDIILILNNIKVKDTKHFNEIVGVLPQEKSVPILVQRGLNPIFLALPIPKH